MHIEMNNENGCGCEQKNSCGGCGHHKHKHMIKWAIKVAVLVLVFCFGFQMGEMKGMLRSQFGGYKKFHGGGWAMPMMYGGGYNDGYFLEQTPASGVESAPSGSK